MFIGTLVKSNSKLSYSNRKDKLLYDQFIDKVLSMLGDRVGDRFDLIVAQIRSLASEQRAGAGPEEEHVTVAEQLVGSHFIEHDATVGAAGDLEAESRGQVGFD